MRTIKYNYNKKNLFLFLSFFIPFLIYFFTAARNVTFEDSGEFLTAIYHLGISHPPGYPLYLISAKLISFLFPLKFQFIVPLFSAFTTSLSLLFLFLTFNIIYKDEIKSFLVILFISISTTLWQVSTISEVYSLNLLLFSIQLYLLLNLIKNFSIKKFYLLIFINSLSLTNHQTSIFLSLIILLLFIIEKWYKKLKPINYFYIFLLIVGGLLPYLYLIIRSHFYPILNWGNPSSIKNFFYVIFRKQYGELSPAFISLKDFLYQITIIDPIYEIFYKSNYTLSHLLFSIFLLLFLLTITFSKKILGKKILIVFVSIFIFYTFFLILITNTPIDKLFTLKMFFIPAWIILYFFLFLFIKRRYLFFLIPIFLFLFLYKFPYINKKNYNFTEDYIKNIMKNLPYNSIIFTLKDNETFPFWEMEYVEKIRNDIKIVNIVLLSEKWYITQLKKIYPELNFGIKKIKGKYTKKEIRNILVKSIIKNNDKNKIYFTTKNYSEFLNFKIPLIPSGCIYSISKLNFTNIIYYFNFKNLNSDLKQYLTLFNKLKLDKVHKNKYLDTPTRYMLQNFANILYETGNLVSNYNSLSYYLISSFLNLEIGVSINNVYNYYKIGNLLLQKGNIEKYRYLLLYSAALQPSSLFSKKILNEMNNIISKYTTIFKKAENFYRNGKFQEAIKYYMKIKKFNSALILTDIGDCYFNMKNLDMAIKYYKKAIEKNKYYITPYYNLGGCYYIKKDLKNAIKIWESGLKIDPENKKLQEILKKVKGDGAQLY